MVQKIAPTAATVRAVITGKPLLSVFCNTSITEVSSVTMIFQKWRAYGRKNAKKELGVRAKRINNTWYWELDKIGQ